jgi:hypothetical protein
VCLQASQGERQIVVPPPKQSMGGSGHLLLFIQSSTNIYMHPQSNYADRLYQIYIGQNSTIIDTTHKLNMHAQNIIILRVKYKHALTQKKAEKEEAIKGIIDRGRETENENLQLILFMYVNL